MTVLWEKSVRFLMLEVSKELRENSSALLERHRTNTTNSSFSKCSRGSAVVPPKE